MVQAVSSIGASTPLEAMESSGKAAGQTAPGGFQDILAKAINEVEGSQRAAAAATDNFLTGKGEELHSAVLAVQRADLEFQLFLQVRNKVMSAYQQIMQVQV